MSEHEYHIPSPESKLPSGERSVEERISRIYERANDIFERIDQADHDQGQESRLFTLYLKTKQDSHPQLIDYEDDKDSISVDDEIQFFSLSKMAEDKPMRLIIGGVKVVEMKHIYPEKNKGGSLPQVFGSFSEDDLSYELKESLSAIYSKPGKTNVEVSDEDKLYTNANYAEMPLDRVVFLEDSIDLLDAALRIQDADDPITFREASGKAVVNIAYGESLIGDFDVQPQNDPYSQN